MFIIGTSKDKKDATIEATMDSIETNHPVAVFKHDTWRWLYALSRSREIADVLTLGHDMEPRDVIRKEGMSDQGMEENNIYESLNVFVGKMLSGNPRPVVLPGTTSIDDLLAADKSMTVLQSWWIDQKVVQVWQDALWWAVATGTAYFKEIFDQNVGVPVSMGGKKLKEGAVSLEVISPFMLFPDFTTIYPNKREWYIELYILPRDKAERFFSKKVLESACEDGTSFSGMSSAYFYPDSHEYTVAQVPSYVVREFWQKGIYDVDHGFGKGKGRVLVRAGGVTVWDGPNPYADIEGLSGLPYTQYSIRKPPDSAYGDGLVSCLVPGDETLNEMNSQIRKNFKAIGDSKLLVPIGSVSRDASGTEGSGEVIEYDQNYNPPHYMDAHPLPPNALHYMGYIRESMQRKVGQTDMSFGTLPTGSHGMSGTALGGLLDSERVQFQLDVVRMSSLMREHAYMALRLMHKFFDTERSTSQTGILNGSKVYAFIGSELELHGDIEIEVRSNFGTTRSLDEERALALYDRQLISEEEVFELTELGTLTFAAKKLQGLYRAQIDLQEIVEKKRLPRVNKYLNHRLIMKVFIDFLNGPDALLLDNETMALIEEYLNLHEKFLAEEQMRRQQVQQSLQQQQGAAQGGMGQHPPQQSQMDEAMSMSPGSGMQPVTPAQEGV